MLERAIFSDVKQRKRSVYCEQNRMEYRLSHRLDNIRLIFTPLLAGAMLEAGLI